METLTIGRIRISQIVEWFGPTRPTWILPDTDRAVVERHHEWLAPHFLDPIGKFLMSIHSFIVQTPGVTMLVNTCLGNDKPRANPSWNMLRTPFLQDLEAAGFPQRRSTSSCAHTCTWITWAGTPVLRMAAGCPRARYLFAQREWEHWSKIDGDEYGPIIADSVRPVVEAGLADLVAEDHRISDDLWLEPTPGLSGTALPASTRSRRAPPGESSSSATAIVMSTSLAPTSPPRPRGASFARETAGASESDRQRPITRESRS